MEALDTAVRQLYHDGQLSERIPRTRSVKQILHYELLCTILDLNRLVEYGLHTNYRFVSPLQTCRQDLVLTASETEKLAADLEKWWPESLSGVKRRYS